MKNNQTTEPVHPFFLDGWLKYNEERWGVKAQRVSYSPEGKDLPRIDAAIFVNDKGQIVLPPMCPFFAVKFTTTSTKSKTRRMRHWMAAANEMASDGLNRGVWGLVALSPEAYDIRPWQWSRYKVGVRYTFFLDFPVDLDNVEHTVRTSIKKATKEGYTVKLTDNLDDAAMCLFATRDRQQFNHFLTRSDLELALKYLGPEHFKVYVAYAKDGEPASSCVSIFSKGTRAIDWAAGTVSKYFPDGVFQLLMLHVFEDLHNSGAIGFDYVGANNKKVSHAKMNWGGDLVPYYTLETYNAGKELKFLLSWLKCKIIGRH